MQVCNTKTIGISSLLNMLEPETFAWLKNVKLEMVDRLLLMLLRPKGPFFFLKIFTRSFQDVA